MNLLKIFTYGGIIEVFVVPHILPCVMGFIPSHISDMIQLAVSLLSSLFPHISVNVQSEVFLKVWKDAGDDQLDPGAPALPDFKSDTTATSSSDGSSPSSGSPQPPAPYSKTTNCRPCGSGGPAQSRDQPTSSGKPATRGPNGGCPEVCRQLANRLTTEAASTMSDAAAPRTSHPLKAAFLGQSATTSSLLSERSDLFARSCSAEYQVMPANSEELVDLRSAEVAAYSGTSAKPRELVERMHPSFAKSCSLEYATVVKTPRAECANEAERVGTSVAELESRRTTSDVRNLAANDGKAAVALESKRKASARFPELSKKFSVKKSAIVVPVEEAKPVYFGDNFQNL